MKKAKIFIVSALILIGLLVLVAYVTGNKTGGNTAAPAQSGGAAQVEGEDKTADAGWREYRIGEEQEIEGLSVAAIYFQPIEMEPAQKAGLKPADADIHLEADITALENNTLGFGAGEFVPYLTVKYQIKNKDNGKEQSGSFMPMNAQDGSHYGANIKLDGAGNYTMTYKIESLEKQSFLIHTDKLTGVPGRFWAKPLEITFDFPWVPRKW